MSERCNQETINKGRVDEIDRIKKINSLYANDKLSASEADEQAEEIKREPLSIDTTIKKRILLSWGGGSDGFDLYFDQNKELIRGAYFSADWGCYFESELTDDEAQLVYDFYMGGSID